jgi:dihydroxyacetone kinase-like protein
MQALELEGVRRMLAAASDAVLAETETLTRADQVIGDGDHGIGMARGFTAVKARLEGECSSIPQALGMVGQALMLNVGGSSGAIFGTMFLSGSRAVTGDTLDAAGFAAFLQAGLEAVQKRGNAKVGDKTMVDALEPAARAAQAHAASPLADCLKAAAQAAWDGMESTKPLVATLGRARTLGERAVGHPDPGAISMALLLRGMAACDAVTKT